MSTTSQAHTRSKSARARRQAFWRDPEHKKPWDALIIGGGVQGACTYHRLAAAGLRVLLVDRQDFAAGTSQASAMLVWGGLLYLRNGQFAEVWRLCAARDELARRHSRWVEPHRMRYVFSRRRRHQPAVVGAALAAYWLLGRCRRSRPRWEPRFDEQAMLGDARSSITFEEARLSSSDAQFVMGWLTQALSGSGCRAVNYAELVSARWERDGGIWRVDLRDALDDYQVEVKARCVVNAAGVWADQVQERCGVLSPWTHALSKGASLSIPRQPWHCNTLLFDDVGPAKGCSLVPWGPVSLWGSTETWAHSIDEGFRPTTEDVHYLLRVLNRHLAAPIYPREIVSLRLRDPAAGHSARPAVAEPARSTGALAAACGVARPRSAVGRGLRWAVPARCLAARPHGALSSGFAVRIPIQGPGFSVRKRNSGVYTIETSGNALRLGFQVGGGLGWVAA